MSAVQAQTSSLLPPLVRTLRCNQEYLAAGSVPRRAMTSGKRKKGERGRRGGGRGAGEKEKEGGRTSQKREKRGEGEATARGGQKDTGDTKDPGKKKGESITPSRRG